MATRRVPTLGSGGKLAKAVLPLPLQPADAGADPAGTATVAQAAAIAAAAADATTKATAARDQAVATAQTYVTAAIAALGFPALAGATDGQVPVFDAAQNKLVLRTLAVGGADTPVTVQLTTTPMGNSGVFTSSPYDAVAGSDELYGSVRLVMSANASFTAVLQVSSDALTWATALTYTVTPPGSLYTVDQATAPTDRYLRWVFTATGGNMTVLNAKAVFTP